MSAPRLTFLYPHLFRRPVVAECPSRFTAIPRQGRAVKRRNLHTTGRNRYDVQSTPQTPSGQAIPLPQPGEGVSQPASRSQDDGQRQSASSSSLEGSGAQEDPDGDGDIIDVAPNGSRRPELDSAESHPAEPVMSTSLELSTRPLERVLHMEPPTSSRDGQKSPHLHAPPYVHHFDTYSLVRDLQNGGFDQQQSISLMKAVRGLLAENIQLAREELVGKSDVENESYLFNAACSELKTEVQNSRRTAADQMRSERAHLQHEVDMLSQRVSQETMSLKDELKGMFDDRKMAVRMEQRSMESHIQELNYKIQSALTGQSKGEVEGLRWFLTRRTAIFIGGLAVAVIVGIQYSVYVSHSRQHKEQKSKEAAEAKDSQENRGNPFTTPSRSTSTQTGDSTDTVLSNMDDKTSQNYVSLG